MASARTSKTQRALQGAARWLAVVAVVLSPWLFGSAEPWAYLMIAAVAGLATVVWLFAVACSPEPEFSLSGFSLLLLLLIGVTVLQMVPLSRSVVAVLNPFSATLTDSANHVLSLLEEGGAAPARIDYTLSLSPGATWRSVWLLVAYVGVLLVLVNTCRHWRHMTSITGVVVLSGFIMALVALVHRFSGSYDILWIHKPRYGGLIFGPFTNRNHFAAQMNMLFGVALGLFLSSQHISEILSWPSWRDRVAWLSSRSASRIALTAFAVVLIGGASCASASRGGMLSLSVGLAMAAVVVTRRRSVGASARMAVFGLSALVVLTMLWLAREDVFRRLGEFAILFRDPMADFRTIATADTLRLYLRCPLTGCGFGAFRHAFTMVQSPDLSDRWLHAHNDWVQLLAEGGWLGTIVFMSAMITLVRYVALRLPELSDRARLFVLGMSVGLCTIALHSVVDYSLHKPGNALLLCFLAAMAITAIHLRHRPPEQVTRPQHELLRAMTHQPPPPPRRWLKGKLRRRAMRGMALSLLTLVCILLFLEGRALRGELAFSRFYYLRRMTERAENLAGLENTVKSACEEARQVQEMAPHNHDALGEVTAELLKWTVDGRLPRELRTRIASQAINCALVSVQGAPSDYLTWLALARTYFTLGMWDQAELCLVYSRSLVRHRTQVRMFAPPADQ
ncbi:MAG: O-antigen ligase family protein [Lentisphaerae bacterium]|nr:O-antigen ligase family protein [Lentisphaerota bacterium]